MSTKHRGRDRAPPLFKIPGSAPVFSENNILKFGYKITLDNVLFISKWINRQVPSVCYDCLPFSGNLHKYETCWSVSDHLNIVTFWTQKYGRYSIRATNVDSWCPTQDLLIKNLSLKNSTSESIKYFLTKYFTENCY